MKKIYITIFLSLIMLAPFQANAVQGIQSKKCFVSLVPERDLMSQRLVELQRKYLPQAQVILAGTPMDILKCLEAGADEITVIAHTTLNKNNMTASIVYMPKLEENQMLKRSNEARKRLEEEIDEIESRRQYLEAHTVVNVDMKLRPLINKMRAQSKDPDAYFGYDVKAVMNHFFSVLLEYRKQHDIDRLVKLRFMVCSPQEVLKSYSGLTRLENESYTKIEFAPKNSFLSFFLGQDVTTFDKKWLLNTNSMRVLERQGKSFENAYQAMGN